LAENNAEGADLHIDMSH
jgi:hypothetical protein